MISKYMALKLPFYSACWSNSPYDYYCRKIESFSGWVKRLEYKLLAPNFFVISSICLPYYYWYKIQFLSFHFFHSIFTACESISLSVKMSLRPGLVNHTRDFPTRVFTRGDVINVLIWSWSWDMDMDIWSWDTSHVSNAAKTSSDKSEHFFGKAHKSTKKISCWQIIRKSTDVLGKIQY